MDRKYEESKINSSDQKDTSKEYQDKTNNELESLVEHGGVIGFAAKSELKNRTKLGKLKKLLSLVFILAIGVLSIYSFVEYMLTQ